METQKMEQKERESIGFSLSELVERQREEQREITKYFSLMIKQGMPLEHALRQPSFTKSILLAFALLKRDNITLHIAGESERIERENIAAGIIALYNKIKVKPLHELGVMTPRGLKLEVRFS